MHFAHSMRTCSWRWDKTANNGKLRNTKRRNKSTKFQKSESTSVSYSNRVL